MLFPDAYGEDFFYIFSLAMPREEFLRKLEEMQWNIAEVMRKVNEKSGIAFPSMPDVKDTTK